MLKATAHEICAFVEASFSAERFDCEKDFEITALSSSGTMTPNSLGFAKRPAPEGASFPSAALLIVDRNIAEEFRCPRLAVERPRLVFAVVTRRFSTANTSVGVHPSAVVDPSAKVDRTATVGANTVIGAGSVIGARTRLGHNIVIGPNVRIGKDSIIGSGCVIGEAGFGVEEYGDNETVRLLHIGGVVIGDRVEIGSMNSIASGTIDPTVIEDGVQTDNLVHIAHNVRVGAGTLITACAEISGSVKIGKRVWLGPNCSVMNGVTIGDDCLIGIGTNVVKSSDPNLILAGNPARALRPRK
jgi:UDP-3-O-[3-hydroxymyristoyl] glucosamine N-acyltransferase LpxD